MSRARALAETLVAELARAADPEYRRNLERLVPGARVRGVRVPRLREMARQLARGAGAPTLEELCDLMDRVCRDGYREEILVVTFALGRSGKQLARLAWERLARWLPALDNWETCDQLATCVAAPMLAAQPALLPRLATVVRSPRAWERRFALATAVGLNQKGRQHPHEALALLEQVVGDPDPMVQKAFGWVMRELAEVDAAAAFAFLVRHKARLEKRVLRESAEKLSAAQRQTLGG